MHAQAKFVRTEQRAKQLEIIHTNAIAVRDFLDPTAEKV